MNTVIYYKIYLCPQTEKLVILCLQDHEEDRYISGRFYQEGGCIKKWSDSKMAENFLNNNFKRDAIDFKFRTENVDWFEFRK